MGSHRGRTSVLIAVDHTLVREGIRKILEAQDDMAVVGDASDSELAVALVAEQKPHVVLLDIGIPGAAAVTTVSRIRGISPETAVMILSRFDGPYLLQSLLQAGIHGYLLMSATIEELVSAIRGCAGDEGRVVLSVSRESLVHLRGPAEARLSEREREVLQLAAAALSNTQIASSLSLSEAAVKRHLRNIFAKLGAVSRIDAVNKAVAASLIANPSPHQMVRPDRDILLQNNRLRRDGSRR